MIPIGRVHELAKYPVKSMAGTVIESAQLGFHGIDGDRRLAFRRLGDKSAFPWLSASRLPDLVRYQPLAPLFTMVRTPDGREVELRGADLQAEIGERLGSAVELMELRNGIFDDGAVSVISLATIAAISREACFEVDPRRMRANVIVDTQDSEPFLEDQWVGATLVVGEAAVSITSRDERCVMVNIDPDTGEKDARVMKAIVAMNDNYAGVYGTVVRRGAIQVGQTVTLVRP